jgi:hypothetical protein
LDRSHEISVMLAGLTSKRVLELQVLNGCASIVILRPQYKTAPVPNLNKQ